jgi:rhamnosyltransferase
MENRIQVLLATHNGLPWLHEQLDSILAQRDVNVEVLVSDDASTDGTSSLLAERAQNDGRIVLLQNSVGFGSAAANFYHLVAHADTNRFEFFALADQDDIWELHKLARHLNLLRTTQADGVSSNVTAFWPNGRKRRIKKSQPQRRWDHLLEPPGPGCTFLISRQVLLAVRTWVQKLESAGPGPLPKHDWFIYLVTRCLGLQWHIDPSSTVLYRQHMRNEVGANSGFAAMRKRTLTLIRGGHQELIRHAIQIARIISNSVGGTALPARFHPLTLVKHGRRRRHEAVLLALFSIGRL